ncbi:MAG: hypothetical protein NZ483_04490 [Verrucomicrobiae bacterium]|nr:hypothetical protein [Verrucomicrobiae bacterium]
MQRVTANMFPDALIAQFARLGWHQMRLQQQAASGLRVQNPADDPAAMRRILQLQDEARAVAQYRVNVARLKERATTGYNALRGLQRIMTRAGEIATLAGGGRSSQELAVFAAEVTQLIRQAVQALNTQHQGDFLFGGTRTDQPPFVITENGDGTIQSVTYQGNTNVPSFEIAEQVTLEILPVGVNTSGSGPAGVAADSRTGADLFASLIALQNELRAGNVVAIQSTVFPALQRAEQNVVAQVASVSALTAHMDTAAELAGTREASLEKLISAQADADLAEVVTRLNQAQTAYQAALLSGTRLLNLSLLDYLR